MTYHISRPDIKFDSWEIFTEMFKFKSVKYLTDKGIKNTYKPILKLYASDHGFTASAKLFSGVIFVPANLC